MLVLFELSSNIFSKHVELAIWQPHTNNWSLIAAVSFCPLTKYVGYHKVFISFGSQVQINWSNNTVSTVGVLWLPFPELQSRQVMVTLFIQEVIIHTQQEVMQSSYAIQISHANGFFLNRSLQEWITFLSLRNNYLRFHTWHSENKIIISRERDVNVFIKEEISFHVLVGNEYKSSVTLLNFSSVWSIELFDFDNLSSQLQATKHMISNIQIHARTRREQQHNERSIEE